ncbi:L-tyrosine/L-tryptophan isonitrile synthase family protein [Renibacterium salmoninarum]|uniref:L-tyrosine/L-tryptophan isonitrile synthase family protein n=1 Tax=Renibacterium salmoninarum TaxID=1646 RepID=UPI000DF7B373|nr:isocyanide synthase family protein [Renibacterium salmoninarum]
MSAAETSVQILSLLLPFRRVSRAETEDSSGAVASAKDFVKTLASIESQVATGQPLTFVLPGFPCKSPNPAKVLGALPDDGERASLRFLNQLCTKISALYSPGAVLVVCSDGHIFADAIGVDQDTIDAYFEQLQLIATAEQFQNLRFFSLRDRYPGQMDEQERQSIIDKFGPQLEQLREQVRADATLTSLYRGIIRFLVEDSVDHTGTRSALQRECRNRAYHVLQRSIAWGEIVSERFPTAIRLSIHPQPAKSTKFGLKLLESTSTWTTPWHAAPVRKGDGSVHLIRRDTVPVGARLLYRNGRPDHFAL